MIKERQNVETEVLSDEQQQEILEKFDTESNVRKFTGKKILFFVSLIAIMYSVYHLYVTFNPLPTLQQRALHVSIGLALIFLIYPAYKKQDRSKVAI